MGKILWCFLFIITAGFSFSLDLSSFDDAQFPLINNIEWKTGTVPDLTLLPDVPGSSLVVQRFRDFKPEITVERLYRIRVSRALSQETVFLILAHIFGNPGTQTKYLYNSYQRKKDIPLIEEAYICNERGKKLGPLVFTRDDIPGTYRYYQYIDEANFSGIVMRVALDITDDYFYVKSENTESLRYGIFPLLSKESMRTDNFIFIIDDTLYVYSLTQLKEDVKIKKIGPYTIRPFGMFGNRMDVMADWVRGEFLLAIGD